ncbi:hypothetical protein [Commensalibacter communis]|uniref:hypothetical protein n=1 Tax=Commensalibacter communis TaxID=2972786 RepID=UPI0022FF7074|nr:hypothetical protein [Commensalibacter communis]CAI3925736.1 unnamed protein product [Commensalibacter communis]CAI3928946.1 unnamed protein product [Commensalibacter communis]
MLYDFSQEDWFLLLDAQHYIPKIILVHVIKNGIRSKDPNNYSFGLMYKMYTAIVFRYGQAMMVTVLVNERTCEIRHFEALEPHNLDEKISQWADEYNQNTIFQRPYIKDIEQYKKDVHATGLIKYDCQEYTDWQWVEKE